jgi:DNA-binding transcriptional ArsR family regulator
MKTPFHEIAELDRTVHDPVRLAILTALSACAGADFLFLQRLTGVTKGNLSSHLAKLEEAGLVVIEKRFIDKRPNTFVRLADTGRTAIDAYWQHLKELQKGVERWRRTGATRLPEPQPA